MYTNFPLYGLLFYLYYQYPRKGTWSNGVQRYYTIGVTLTGDQHYWIHIGDTLKAYRMRRVYGGCGICITVITVPRGILTQQLNSILHRKSRRYFSHICAYIFTVALNLCIVHLWKLIFTSILVHNTTPTRLCMSYLKSRNFYT